MKIDEIGAIVKLMADNDLTEFKIKTEDMTLQLKRGGKQIAAPVVAPAILPAVPAVSPVAAPVPAAAEKPAPAAGAASAPAAVDPSKVIESPIVGTFYRSASPGGEPLVKVGMKVDADTTVCIVEAMKVMNEIKAEKTGTVKEVLVENGQPVEFGQPLFVLE